MTGYHLEKRITVTNFKPENKLWRKHSPYQVRSDGQGLTTLFHDADTLTEARRIARARCKACGWAEVFRWAETGVMIKALLVAVYEREVTL